MQPKPGHIAGEPARCRLLPLDLTLEPHSGGALERMPIRGKLEDTALGGAGDQRRQGPPSTQHLRGHTNETPRVSLTNVTTPPSPHPPREHTVETRAAAEQAHAVTGGEELEAHAVGRRLYASSRREDAAMVGPAGGTAAAAAAAAAAASASHAASSSLPGALTARGPGAGETRAATSDLLGMTTRAGGAALTLLLVVLLLRMAARMPWAEALTSEEERRKADSSRHRQAGMRVPLLRSALRLVSRARASLSSELGHFGSALPRWRWLGRRASDEMSRAEKMHSTPERAESGTVGMGELHRMPRPASVETEMSDLSVRSTRTCIHTFTHITYAYTYTYTYIHISEHAAGTPHLRQET